MSDDQLPPDVGGYSIPFETFTIVGRDVQGVLVDSCNVTAGVSSSPLGLLPVLLVDFASSALTLEQQPPRLMFIAPPQILRDFRSLVNQAVAAALKAASEKGGTPWA